MWWDIVRWIALGLCVAVIAYLLWLAIRGDIDLI